LRSIINDPNLKPRERTAAIRALATICKAELDAVRIATLVKRLGHADDTCEKAEDDGEALREYLDITRQWIELEKAQAELEADRAQLKDNSSTHSMHQP